MLPVGLIGVLVYPAVNSAVERSYIKRCVEHRADTCAPSDRRRAKNFCQQNPLAYLNDTSPPVKYRSTQYGDRMTNEEKAIDRCETAFLYHHRNDGLLGGLLKSS